MQVTIDRVGRIVIPKRVRDALGLTAHSELEVIFDGTGIRLEPVPQKERVVEVRDGLPLLGALKTYGSPRRT